MADTVIQELKLDINSFEQSAQKAETVWDNLDTRSTRMGKESPFKKQTDDLIKYTNQLKNGGQLFDKVALSPKALQKAIDNASQEYVKLIKNQEKAAKAGNFKENQDAIKRTRAELDLLNKKLDETIKKQAKVSGGGGGDIGGGGSGGGKGEASGLLGKFAGKAAGALGVLGIGIGAAEVLGNIKDITAEFQKYEAVLTNTLGSQNKAAAALDTIQKFAAQTPVSVAELTESFVKLANQGFVPTENQLRQLGDLASSLGKPFDQLVEAILDASTGEFERLKEFGVKAKKSGDDVTFTFKGQTTTVKNTEEAIRNYVLGLGDLKGVSGSMAAISGTLTGQISNLGDTMDSLYLTIGKKLAPVFTVLISAASYAINGIVKLFKTMEPAFDRVFSVFGKLFGAIGGVLSSFGQIVTAGLATSTTAQKIGYYFTKFVIDPFLLLINTSAQLIEAFNFIVIAGQLAAAKLKGDDSLVAVLNKQLDESKGRLAELRTDFAATVKDAQGNLDEYVRRDNQRTRREERRSRLNQEDSGTAAPKAKKDAGPTDKEKKAAESLATKLANEREKLLKEREKLNDELAKLQEESEKLRLESLDKNGKEYIQLKRKLDLQEIDDQRKKLIELGQMATGTPVYDTKLKKVVVKKNDKYALPAATEAIFSNRKAIVEGRSGEDEFDADRLSRVKDFRDAETKFEKDQALKRENDALRSGEIELELRQRLLDAESELIRKAGESEQDYEKRKNAQLLAIRLKYYQQLLALAENDPSRKEQILGLKETINGIQKEIKDNTAQARTGPQDLWDLLGITFDTNAEKNDQFKQLANEATKTVVDNVNAILSQQLQADQARIDSYDRQIQAKQSEVQTEATLAAAGLANSLNIKKQEEATLQAERKKAVEAQRRDQAIQISLNAVLQESELALAVAKIFSSTASIPLIGFITAGIEIAAMLALFGSTISQISSLPKYHDGDEVTHLTARKRSTSGSKKHDEVDARLQVGEGVTRKEAYQPNKVLFSRLNKFSRGLRSSDLESLLAGTGVELPPSVRESDLILLNQVNQSQAYQPDRELHSRVDGLAQRMDVLIEETRKGNKGTREQLPDGRIRQTDSAGNVTVFNRT